MNIVFFTGLTLAAALAAQAAESPKGPATIRTNRASTTASTNAFVPNAPLSNPEANSILKNDEDKLSYSFGLNMGSNIKRESIDVNPDAVIRGIKDGLEGKPPLMNEQEVRQIQDHFRRELMAKREAKAAELREKNKAEGEKFLAENAKKEGVKTLPGGVQYKVIKEGSGPKPAPTDRVKVQYRGKLINGTEFDSSYKRGPEPATFGVSQVIKGWTQALTNMPVGSHWELYIPSDLAYGPNGSGRLIEPNSTLIFDVDLVDIVKPEPPPQPITSDIIKVPSKAELDAGAKIEVIKPEDLAKYTNKNGQAKSPVKPAPPK
jgi:FKBP-type peptidyl-prolyl cis-trans isomerase FklB